MRSFNQIKNIKLFRTWRRSHQNRAWEQEHEGTSGQKEKNDLGHKKRKEEASGIDSWVNSKTWVFARWRRTIEWTDKVEKRREIEFVRQVQHELPK